MYQSTSELYFLPKTFDIKKTFYIDHAFVHFFKLIISRRWITVPLLFTFSWLSHIMHRIQLWKLRQVDLWQRNLITCFVKKQFHALTFFLTGYNCMAFFDSFLKEFSLFLQTLCGAPLYCLFVSILFLI